MNVRPAARLIGAGATATALVLLAACATRSLNAARQDFYAGRYAQANQVLDRSIPSTDRVLFLMERGTIRLSLGDYAGSARDLISAYDRLEQLQTYSASRGGASVVVNDTVKEYRGYPYERALLHAFTAKDHLALGHWEDAAVEARRTLDALSPEVLGDYPDDAYARYVAGLCLELIGDRSNAELQYRKAGALLEHVGVDDRTGRVGARDGTNEAPRVDGGSWPAELVCLVMMGRAPQGQATWRDDWAAQHAAHAEIVINGQVAGRSYTLTDVLDLAFTTDQKQAAQKMVKTVARIAAKEALAHQIEKDNELLGELVRFVLIGLLEKPDTRRWETLPRLLQVARVPCPPDLTTYTVVFRTSAGAEMGRLQVDRPLQRQDRTFVSFCRDLPAQP